MGMLDRLRGKAPEELWHRPVPGICKCTQHVENMGETEIAARPPVTVGWLLESKAFTVGDSEELYLYGSATGHRRGPYQWRLSYTKDVARLLDADAPAHIDDVLFIQGGIDTVLRLDDTTLAVGCAELCAQGIGAAFVDALGNPRLRV